VSHPRLGPNSPLLAAQGAAKSAVRHDAGQSLEALVNLTGAWYARKGWGVFVEHHVPTKVVKRATDNGIESVRVATEKAIVDRSGHMVRRWQHPDTRVREFVPMYFDIKGFAGHASYQHERAAMHQVEFLQERQRDGVLGFLLLIDDHAGRAWVLHRARDLEMLRQGGRVTVCERRGRLEFAQHFLPNVERTPDGSREAPPGYHIFPLLERVLSGELNA